VSVNLTEHTPKSRPNCIRLRDVHFNGRWKHGTQWKGLDCIGFQVAINFSPTSGRDMTGGDVNN